MSAARPITLAALLALATILEAASPVVRPAPEFSFAGIGGTKTLRSLRGRPVVVVVAKSAKTRAFRKQLESLATIYHEFASRGTVFVCAFADDEGRVPSNIPFVVTNNGAAVAAAYGMRDDFAIGIVGIDGNLDLTTRRVLPAFRVREVILNSYTVQNNARKELPKGPPQ
jgi:AhpC/TSA family